MGFDTQLKKLRKSKKWSQKELADKLGVHPKHISRYENNVSKPSLEMLLKLRDTFRVSLDYLVYNDDSGEYQFKDRELQKYFEEVDQLNDEDKELIKKVIESMLLK